MMIEIKKQEKAMIEITLDQLEDNDACQPGIDLFKEVFGEVAHIDVSHPGFQQGLLMYAPFALGWLWRKSLLPQWSMSQWKLAGMKLSEAILSEADLSGADLSGADLSGADLGEANLSGANLRGADLSGADLREAILSGADLRGANLIGAIYNKHTILPDNVDVSDMIFDEE